VAENYQNIPLSPYDELPVHQTPYPLSVVNSTDNGFDDGYFFGAFSAEARAFCFQGLRVNPNTDLVGGYVGLMRDGRQRTVRFSRTWRELCDTWIGPYRFQVLEPYRHLRLTLDENESGLSCDLHWRRVAPAFLEAHHLATNRGRPTTDQTRYSQPGVVEGWIDVDGERIEVDPSHWYGSRDHSWGIYFDRPPLAADPALLPPRDPEGVGRALRFYTVFAGENFGGFWHFHETADGRQAHEVSMNDTFATPFEGRISIGWDKETVRLTSVAREIRLVPGTRLLDSATIRLTDSDGGVWVQELEAAGSPWVTSTMGYQAGSWKDGGSFRTYHGPGVQLEWDEFDFSMQPFDHRKYDGTVQKNLHGKEYVARITTTAPDGRRWVGACQIELFLDGRYDPLGLE
jgi:hypothetical protein